jgi:hypothetical protein
MVAGTEPNSENKIFVGGCPGSCGEDDLRGVRSTRASVTPPPCMPHAPPARPPAVAQLFEKHGQVEEVFVMRGGSRSGMVCAFVRFASAPMAQAAIDAVHGQTTLPGSPEPLVVRWADAPGSRKRDGREGRSKRGGAGAGAGRDHGGVPEGWPQQMMMANGVYGAYPQMMMAQTPMLQQGAMLQHQAALNGASFAAAQYYPQGQNFGGNGMVPGHMAGAQQQQWQQQQMMLYAMEQARANAARAPSPGPRVPEPPPPETGRLRI